MTTTVYLVSDGEYDDYRVRCLFADHADAHAYVAELGGRVEEFPLVGRLDLDAGPALLHVVEGQVVREDLLSESDLRSLGRRPVVGTRRVWPGANAPVLGEIAVDVEVVNAARYGPMAYVEVLGYDEAAVRARYDEVAADKRREVAGMPDLRETSGTGGTWPAAAGGGFVRYDEHGVDVTTMGG